MQTMRSFMESDTFLFENLISKQRRRQRRRQQQQQQQQKQQQQQYRRHDRLLTQA